MVSTVYYNLNRVVRRALSEKVIIEQRFGGVKPGGRLEEEHSSRKSRKCQGF